MNLLNRLLGNRDIQTIDDYVELYNQFYYGGTAYGGFAGVSTPNIQQTLGGQTTEPPVPTFVGHVMGAYKANGPIFACELVRMSVFSSVRFSWQRMLKGAPSDLWANDPQLRILQKPWMNATTQDLLIRMILDADLAGNAYITYDAVANELVHLRPDWVEILLQERYLDGGPSGLGEGQIGWRKVGFIYTEGGRASGQDPVFLPADQVAHFHPIPDPLATYRGMSWLTPVLREIQADQAMTTHQRKYFDNGATPNLIVKYQVGTTLDKIKAFKEIFSESHEGVQNAYKTLHLAPGADPVPMGANLKDIDFQSVRGGGETRIAAAANVPPIIAGFSEGLASATYSNYSQARRRFADGTMHPLWENAAGTLESVLTVPDGSRLWYDATGVPFLREDEKDAALIAQIEANTINLLITAGFKPDTAVAAVLASDWRLLDHTGLNSVQLLPPGVSLKPAKPGTTNGANANPLIVGLEDGMTEIQREFSEAIEEIEAVHNGGPINENE